MLDQTLASSSESMLLAAQEPPTSPINVVSTALVVPADTASQFNRELQDIRVAKVVSMNEGPNATHRSHTRNAGLGYRPRSGVA